MPSAYLLVSHGSRDPRPQASVEQLAELLCQKARVGVSRGLEPLVGTACLELAPLPLHEQIQQFGKKAVAAGYNQLQVLPLFLLPGVHVMEDIPAEVAIAQQALGSDLKIDIRPHLGSHPGLGSLLATQVAALKADARILLSHGSRRAGGNQPVEAMAATLGAVPAYWSVPPSLESRVKAFVSLGCNRIVIIPYFLFCGGITDAIAEAVELIILDHQLRGQKLHLAEPIGASTELADLIWDLRSK